MPSEALSFRTSTHSPNLNIPVKESLPSMEYYNQGMDRPRQALSMEHGENEWNRPYKTEGSMSYHSPQYPSQSEPQFLGRSTLILPPPSSLMPTFNYRPTMMTTGHQYSGYNVFVDQSDIKSTKRKRNSSPPANVSTPGCHYEVLNMTKRKRSKRDATAAETLASFSRFSTNTAPYYSAEGAACGDKYKHTRGRNKGDSGCYESQSLVFELESFVAYQLEDDKVDMTCCLQLRRPHLTYGKQ